MRLKYFFLSSLLLMPLTSYLYAYGIDYSSIVPGVTARTEIDTLLGAPIREIVPGSVYRYHSEHYAVEHIDIFYDRISSRIKYFTFYFIPDKFYKKDILSFFNLISPVSKAYGLDGNLIEVYFPEGMLVRYSSTGDNSAVSRVDVLESRLSQGCSRWYDTEEKQIKIFAMDAVLANAPYKGVRVLEVKDNGQASKAGILPGDIIHQVEDFIFGSEFNIEPFRKTIALMPLDQGLKFVLTRTCKEKDSIEEDRVVHTEVSLRTLTQDEKFETLNNSVYRMRKQRFRQLISVRDFNSSVTDINIAPDAVSLEAEADLLPFVDTGEKCDFSLFSETAISEKFFERDISRFFPGIFVRAGEYNTPGTIEFKFDYRNDNDLVFIFTEAVIFMHSREYKLALEDLYVYLNSRPQDMIANYAAAVCNDYLDDIPAAVFYYNKAKSLYSDNEPLREYFSAKLEELDSRRVYGRNINHVENEQHKIQDGDI